MPKYEPWMSHRRVSGWGRTDASIVLIGEAPGTEEAKLGAPFVGASGAKLFGGGQGRTQHEKGWVVEAGLSREQFRIENVCEYCPPNMAAELVDEWTWKAWMEDLHERIARLDDPRVLVPTGNYALYALTGKGKVHWHQRDGKSNRPGILSWRGSILQYTDRRGRQLKVVPTPHPAATFPGRDPGLEPICRRDWVRIAAELATPALNLPQRTHLISPTLGDLRYWVQLVEQATADDILVLDIENPQEKHGAPIVCVGFCLDEKLSITIPTTKAYWGDALPDVWATIRYILSLPVHKGAWNNFHEQYWLYEEQGIVIENLWWDGMYMHHALDPSAPHALAFCASVDTREPYWKDEAKDPKDAKKYTSNMAAFYTYNGKDCCVTWELIHAYYERLLREKRPTSRGDGDGIDFYLRHYAELHAPLLGLTRSGIRVDPVRREQRYRELTERAAQYKRWLIDSGCAVFTTAKGTKGDISRQKLSTYLYTTLGLPTQYKRNKKKGEKTATTDEVAIRTLMQKYPDAFTVLPGWEQSRAPWILERVRVKKLSEFYDKGRIDDDGYFRSGYSPNTEAGRLNSKENPRGGGSNAQNIDREARDMFLADPGHLGVGVDLSQIEARINYVAIYALTGDRDLLHKAQSRPGDYDQHSEMARKIFGKTQADWDALTPADRSLLRYLGKTTVHAAQRDQGPKGLSDRLAKDGHYFDLAQCKRFIDGYRRAMPGLEELFRDIRRRVMADRMLMTDWGRILRFDYARLDDNTYRAAYSFDPQANCADHMNQKGLIPFHWWLTDEKAGRINQHGHDSLFFSVRPERAYDATKFLVESLESPYVYHGTSLAIPCELSIGLTMKGSHSWKQLPSRTHFEEVMYDILKNPT